MFEFPAFLLPTNREQPMHSPSALTEHVSLNLAGTFLLDPVQLRGAALRLARAAAAVGEHARQGEQRRHLQRQLDAGQHRRLQDPRHHRRLRDGRDFQGQ